MPTFFHHPSEAKRQEDQGQQCPEGWTGPHNEAESAAWAADWAARYIPPAKTYSTKDYEAAIDRMLQAQCTAHEGYTFESIVAASSYAARPSGYFYLAGCWYADLRDYCWATAGQRAKQPPSTTPPAPDELAAYLLATFTAEHPFPT